MAVEKTPLSLKYVRNQTQEMCMIAIKNDFNAFEYVIDITPEICKFTIEIYPEGLYRIIKKSIKLTEELYLIAIKKDPMNLQFIKEQTPEMCILAVKKNGLALRYVFKQTKEICTTALKQNFLAGRYIRIKMKWEYKSYKLSEPPLDGDVCPICLDLEGEWCELIACHHKFHIQCIELTLQKTRNICSLCTQNIEAEVKLRKK